MTTYRFYKEGSKWYIDLPQYLAEGGCLGDLPERIWVRRIAKG